MVTLVDELMNMEWPHETDDIMVTRSNRADKKLLKNMHAWVVWVESIFPGINFTILDVNDFDSFLMIRNMTPVTMSPTAPEAPVAPAAPAATLQIEILPILSQSQYLPPASFMPNVKPDVKQYPIFNDDEASWMKFKWDIISIVFTHGLDDIFNENMTILVVHDQDYPLFKKNNFIYFI